MGGGKLIGEEWDRCELEDECDLSGENAHGICGDEAGRKHFVIQRDGLGDHLFDAEFSNHFGTGGVTDCSRALGMVE